MNVAMIYPSSGRSTYRVTAIGDFDIYTRTNGSIGSVMTIRFNCEPTPDQETYNVLCDEFDEMARSTPHRAIEAAYLAEIYISTYRRSASVDSIRFFYTFQDLDSEGEGEPQDPHGGGESTPRMERRRLKYVRQPLRNPRLWDVWDLGSGESARQTEVGPKRWTYLHSDQTDLGGALASMLARNWRRKIATKVDEKLGAGMVSLRFDRGWRFRVDR